MNLMDYIVKDAYILIPVLYVIGVFLKRTPRIPDWLIPWILLVLGMIGAFFLSGMKLGGVLQGVLVADLRCSPISCISRPSMGRKAVSNSPSKSLSLTLRESFSLNIKKQRPASMPALLLCVYHQRLIMVTSSCATLLTFSTAARLRSMTLYSLWLRS